MMKTAGSRSVQRGYSLVELMIAITLGLMILAGVTTVFVKNSATRTEIERGFQQSDNGLFALHSLSDEVRNAGYYADLDPRRLPQPTTIPDVCEDSALSTLLLAMPLGIQGVDNSATVPSCLTDVKAGTDIVAFRRIATCAAGAPGCDAVVAGTIYLQPSRCDSATELASPDVSNFYRFNTDVTALDRQGKGCTGTASFYRYRTDIYFVANNDKTGDGIPTLKRAELGPDGFVISSIAQGVENFQIEYGIDSGTIANSTVTGVAGAFTADPETFNSCTPANCARYWSNVVAARLHLLVRTSTPTPGYQNDKTYYLGLNADGSNNSYSPVSGDGYKRRVFSATVRLNNIAGRNTP